MQTSSHIYYRDPWLSKAKKKFTSHECTTDSTSFDVDTFSASDLNACHWSYVVVNGDNVRSGSLMAAWNGLVITLTDLSTYENEVGNTTDIQFTAVLYDGNVILRSIQTLVWIIKYTRDMLV
jgi:hypothetical protein